MNKMPFIKKFKIESNFYIYDVGRNSFFKVDELFYNLIASGEEEKGAINSIKYSAKDVNAAKDKINQMKKNGYFSNKRPNITYFHDMSKSEFLGYLKESLDKKIYKITLTVTENCNLRCKYCAYSGEYKYNREHNRTNMSPEIMKKTIDFYFSKSPEIKEKNISFYGGEPLLNFSLIKKCVNYIKEKYSQPVEYNMTTNATLLDKEKIQFLKENKFSLLVSIDGPKPMHDRYRVFESGKGTFDTVINNLKTIKTMYPNYFKSSVRFNIVLPPPLNFEEIDKFISELDINPAGIRFSDVTDRFTTFFDQFDTEQINLYNKARQDLLASFNTKLITNTKVNEVEKSFFFKRYLHIHKRDMEKLPSNYPSNGQCIVGARSLLVNSDGSLNFCTQMDDVFNLGNVESGFDIEEIEKIYINLDKFFSENCHNCWAIRFCMKCIKDINQNGEIDAGIFTKVCQQKKRSIMNEIKDYIRIRESNTNVFDYLKEVTIN